MPTQVKENPLQVIVRESGLEIAKAQFVLEKFQSYFEIAAEWEQKAKSIVVTNESQTAEMQMARVGRLFLRDKRIDVEKARKKLKEQALREGKAIDGIANVLKALIVPTEKYLEQQEKFVEIRQAKINEEKRKAFEQKMEEERIAKEKAEAEERERIRVENEQLKKEAIAREAKAKAEREEQTRKLAEQKAKAKAEREEQNRILVAQQEQAEAEKRKIEAKALKEKQAIEEKAKVEREKRAKEYAEQKAIAQKEKEQAEAEKQQLAKKLELQVECPFCHKKFTPNKKG